MTIEEQFSLKGKTAFISGGARNLGFQIAEVLAEAGANLIISSRSLERAKEAGEDLQRRFGIDVLPLELDVTIYEDIARTTERIKIESGGLDILVNNAGNAAGESDTSFLKRDPFDIEAVIRLNLISALWCSQSFGGMMAEQKSGKIINIASIAGIIGRDRRLYHRTGLPEQPIDYAASKAGLIGATKDLAAYFAPYGVYVNAISPGGFERGQPEAFIREYSDRTPLGRMGRDGIDLRGAALYLASSASDYVTGHNLVVDGGFTIWQ